MRRCVPVFVVAGGLVGGLGAAASLAAAQSAAQWPTRAIHAIIPFGAGSATDIVPRIVFDQLSAQLGQPIVVENRTGAGGTLGTAAVAKSDPDGYTVLATSTAHTITPSVYANLAYNPGSDFAAVIPFGMAPNVLVISPAKGFKTVQELVAAAKAKPGTFNYASVGVGSATHLSVEKLRLSAGFDAVHVPFRGGPEALTEVMAGRVDFYFCPINTALPFIRDGKLLGLVANGTRRSSELPDVPTTLEAGYVNAEFPFWIGMLAPAKTPPEIVAKLHDETAKALQLPATREKLAKNGIDTLSLTVAEFETRIRKELEDNRALARAAGINPN
jgi:tripartite-type tricarboxylate transporter receptor subunit TctC